MIYQVWGTVEADATRVFAEDSQAAAIGYAEAASESWKEKEARTIFVRCQETNELSKFKVYARKVLAFYAEST